MIATLINSLSDVFTNVAEFVKTVIGEDGIGGVFTELSSTVFGG